MEYNLRDKVVVITGGAGGIGYAIADNFLSKNVASLILVDVNEDLGISAQNILGTRYGKRRVVFYKGDVLLEFNDLCTKIFWTHKNIDVLVNCAGIGGHQLAEKTLNINMTAVIKWSLKFHKHMRLNKFGKGTIINISSVLGYRIRPYAPVYQASKFAVLGFSKSLGHTSNFKKFGVRVLTICPGFTESNLIKSSTSNLTEFQNEFKNCIKNATFQKADVVGKATVKVFEMAESGTVWEIENSNPLVLVP